MALPKLQQIIVSPRVVKPRDYTLAGNTINALNERHDAALTQRSAIANDLAKNYILHESEDEFKTNFTNEMLGRIDEKIDANSEYAGNALSETIKVAGEYAIDPRLTGRVRANNDYKAYMDKLEQLKLNNVITDLTYNRLKAENPYSYVDIYEGEDEQSARKNRELEAQGIVTEHGARVIGGTKWEPNSNPVKHYAASDILDEAVTKFVSPIKTNGQSFIFIDENGKETTDRSKSYDGTAYIKTSSGRQAVTEQMINDAVNALVEANPEYSSSLHQDYLDERFDFEKHPENYSNNSDLLNETGVPRSEKDYINHIFGALGKNKAYDYRVLDTSFGDGKKNWIAAHGNLNSKTGIDLNEVTRQMVGMASNNSDFQVDLSDLPAKTKASMDICTDYIKSKIVETLYGKGKDEKSIDYNHLNNVFNGLLDENSRNYYDEYKQIVEKHPELLDYIDEYNDQKSLYDSMISEGNKDSEAIKFISEVNTGSSIYSDSSWSKKFSNILKANNIDETSSIMFTFDDNDNGAYKIVSDALVNIPGIRKGTKNGKRYIEFKANNANNIMVASRAYTQAADLPYYFIPNIEASINGKKVEPYYETGPYGNLDAAIDGKLFRDINALYKSASDKSSYALNHYSKGPATISNVNYPGRTVTQGDIDIQRMNNIIDTQEEARLLKLSEDELYNKLYGDFMIDHEVYWVDDNGYMKLATNEEKQSIRDRLHNREFKDLAINTSSNPFSVNQLGINVTVPKVSTLSAKDGLTVYDSGFTIYIDGFDANSPAGLRLRNDNNFKARNDYQRRASVNQPKTLRLGNNDSLIVTPDSAIKGSIINNDPNNYITQDETIELFDLYNQYRGFKNRAIAGYDLNQGKVKEIAINSISNLSQQYAALSGNNMTYAANLAIQLLGELGITLNDELQ